MSEFVGRKISPEALGAVLVSKQIGHHLQTSGVLVIENPGDMRSLIVQAEVGDWRHRPGDYDARLFGGEDVVNATNRITLTAHGYATGEGPFRLTTTDPALAGAPGIVITTGPDLLTRDAGSWLDEGFAVGQTITIGGSASNDGPEVILLVTDLVITTVGTLTPEGTQTDLTVTAVGALPAGWLIDTDYFVIVIDDNTIQLALTQNNAVAALPVPDPITTDGGGLMELGGNTDGTIGSGWANAAVPAATETRASGYGSVLLGMGATIVLSAGQSHTFVSFDATGVLTYWFAG